MTTGDLDRAVAHLAEAVHRNLALGHWPAVAASRLRYAEALERRGEPADGATVAEQRAMAAALAGTGGPATGLALPAAPALPAGPDLASCSRHGTKWRIGLGSRSTLVGRSIGMLHIAVLIANPGAEIAAIDLVAGLDTLAQAARNSAMPAQQLLDGAAVRRYRNRLAQLSDQADELAADGDHEGADRARAERHWLVRELAAGTRPGGRARAFSDNAERARIAVGRSIRRALSAIEHADPVIGAHLRTSVHTGTRCWYRPP
jgi:hypothetical protein